MQSNKKRSVYLALVAAAVIGPVMADSVAYAAESQDRARLSRAAPPAKVVLPPLPSLPIASGGSSAPQRCFETVLVPAPVAVPAPTEAASAPSDGRQRRGSAPRAGAAPKVQPGPTFLSVPVPCPGEEMGGGDGAGLLLGGGAPELGGAGPEGPGPAQEGGDGGAPGAGESGESGDAGLGGGDPFGALPPLSDLGDGGLGDGGLGGEGPAGLPLQDPPGEGGGAGTDGSPVLAVVSDPGRANGIPEPSVVALMGMGALAIGMARRRWRKR